MKETVKSVYQGDIKTVTTPVEAYVSLFSDRGSFPLVSITEHAPRAGSTNS